eukprot:5018899-Pyramimonas_sp.AAC.1
MLRGADASASQVWPWRLADRLAWGVEPLPHRRKWQRVLGERKHCPLLDDELDRVCIGCERHRSAAHP